MVPRVSTISSGATMASSTVAVPSRLNRLSADLRLFLIFLVAIVRFSHEQINR